MKRIITVIVVAFAISAAAFSQTPSFRGRGYKGSVSYTNMLIVWNGLDTSHGFMFDERHYLGVGGGFCLVPDGLDFPTIVHLYADYHAYCFKKASTLVAGIKIGYVDSVHPSTGNIKALELEPNIGWNWGLESGQGLTLSLGACMMTVPIRFTESSSLPFTVIPRCKRLRDDALTRIIDPSTFAGKESEDGRINTGACRNPLSQGHRRLQVEAQNQSGSEAE